MTDTAVYDPAADGWSARPGGPYMTMIGPIWERPSDRGPQYGMLADRRHANHRGIVHGGVIMGFADYALGMVAAHEAGTLDQVTIQLDVQFIAAGLLERFITAETRLTRRTRTMFFCQGEVLCDGEIIAAATGIWKSVPPLAR